MNSERQKTKTSDKRGGSRPGAGRKPIGSARSVTLTYSLPPELKDELQAYLRRRNIPMRIFVAEALKLMNKIP